MQLSNFEKDHVNGFRATEKIATMASVAYPDQGVPLEPPTITNTKPDDEEDDPDGLVFTGAGMWHSEVCSEIDLVGTPPPSIALEPLHEVPVAPTELLHPGMWCAPATFVQQPSPIMLSFVERESYTTDEKDTCAVSAHVETNKNVSDCAAPQNATAQVTRLEAVWLSLLLLFGAGFALGLQYATKLKAKLLDIAWCSVKVQLFFWTTLFWDTVAVYTVLPKEQTLPAVPRRIRRKVQRHCRQRKLLGSLFFCASSWLVLSDSVHDIYQGAQPAHPFVEARHRVLGTYRRIQSLERRLDLTPGTFLEWQKLQCKSWYDELYPQPAAANDAIDENEMEEFFDAYEDPPVDCEEFFDTHQTEGDTNYVSWDLLQLDSIYTPRMVIDCSSTTLTALDDPAALFSPSDRALQALQDDRLSDPSGFFTVANRVVSVILDTGASLGVSPFDSDFLEPPTPPSRPMFIGSMSSGLRITGIGKIDNTFTANDGTEVTLISDGYLVPQENARLCSPQRVLCKKRGIFGKFEGNEDAFSLLLEGAPPITVKYQKTSNLPVEEVLLGPQPEPTINLAGVMSEENQNLTTGQKLLLEWYARFGHQNFASIQRLMRFFPFTSQKLGAAAK
jgi:hypothetical protein